MSQKISISDLSGYQKNIRKEVFFTQWLKSDGDWVEEDQPIFVVNFDNPRNMLPKGVLSEKSGFIQFHKKEEDELINPDDKIYTLYPPGLYEKENSPAKSSFCVYLDKNKYTIPKKYYNHSLEIKNEIRKMESMLEKAILSLYSDIQHFMAIRKQ